MSTPITATESAAASTPPSGWVVDERRFLRNYYWSTEPGSLKDILRTHYDLENADPVWIRNREFGSVEFIFKAKPKNEKDTLFYYYSGLSDTPVLQFEEKSLDQIKEDIETHGGKQGHLAKLKFKNLNEPAERT